MFRILLTTCLLGLSLFLAAQDFDDPKLGRLTDEERTSMVYEADTSAEAVVLFDYKSVRFGWNNETGPNLQTLHHRRIKLLKASSFDRADIELGYVRREQDISGLKAFIHLPTGGTIKLKKKDFLEEDYNDEYRTIKFTFPQVTEGAIIEYQYTKANNHITFLPRHYFTQDIPVVYSEYRAQIPVYYDYVSLGNEAQLDIREAQPINARFDAPIGGPDTYGNGMTKHTQDPVRHEEYRGV